MLSIWKLDYFKKEEALLVDDVQNDNISSDIIESDFGIFKTKKSPPDFINVSPKLRMYGITPFMLLISLYLKLVKKSVADTYNF